MNRLSSFRVAALFCALVAFSGLAFTDAAAQKVDFAGKRIEMLVPFNPGGGSDVYSRALAPFFEKYLPGNPTIIVRNVPGGGSITGANQFHNRAKPDGLHVLISSSSTVMNFVFRKSKFELDLSKMQPIVLSPQGSVVYVAPSLGVKSAKDIKKLMSQALTFGGNTPTGAEMRVTTAFDLLGLKVKYVWGIERGPARLAFERGELTINYDTTPGYTKNASQLVKAGKAVPLFTLGILDEKGELQRDPNFKDLPNFAEVYEMAHGKKPSGPAYEAWKAVLRMGVMANKAVLLPADTPKPIVEAWRTAIRKTLEDPEFDAKAGKVIEGYPQFIGESARPILKSATTLPPEVWEWLKNFLKTKHDVTL
ncbi:MAG: Tripartite tricarboxylate transporter family receptor [Burkholderiales bacterium]|nr:Tripartite tricarboxylate transporter family receptor [Burkholderiales bacterium]